MTETAVDGNFKRLEEEGFASGWLPNIFSHDGMTAIALAGDQTSTLEMGTYVVPTYPRHPFVMAQQALSTAAATGNRFVRMHVSVRDQPGHVLETRPDHGHPTRTAHQQQPVDIAPK